MRIVLAIFLALALVAGACGDDDDTASDDTAAADDGSDGGADSAGVGAGTDDGAEPADVGAGTDDGVTTDDGEATDDGRDDAATPDGAADIDTVCELNRELAATAQAAFGDGVIDDEAIEIATTEYPRLLEAMADVAPAELGPDLERYREALEASFALVVEYGFDIDAIPQEAIDEYAEQYPDANLFGSSELENGLREWFAANCPEEFAF